MARRRATSSSAAAAGPLILGTLLPQTGSLAFLGPPEFAGVDAAIKDINAKRAAQGAASCDLSIGLHIGEVLHGFIGTGERPEDLAPFAALNGDAETMRYFKAKLTRAESDAMVARLEAIFDEHGYGFWAVEAPGVAPLIGAVGLLPLKPELPFYPGVEIGWRWKPSSIWITS